MATVLSLLVLTMIALLVGAYLLWRRGGSRLRIALLLILVAVMAANVAIWTLPDDSGDAPLGREPRQARQLT